MSIYVNNVDVTDCQFIEGPINDVYPAVCNCIDARDCEGYIDALLTFCEDNPNCYYKQLLGG